MFDVRSGLFDIRSQNLRVIFKMFEVRCVNVRGIQCSAFWCSYQDYYKYKDWVKIFKVTFPDGVTTNTIPKFPSSILFARNN